MFQESAWVSPMQTASHMMQICGIIRQSLLDNLIMTVKKKKLKWCSQIVRDNDLSTAILQSTNLGKRGKQKRNNWLTMSINGLDMICEDLEIARQQRHV